MVDRRPFGLVIKANSKEQAQEAVEELILSGRLKPNAVVYCDIPLDNPEKPG